MFGPPSILPTRVVVLHPSSHCGPCDRWRETWPCLRDSRGGGGLLLAPCRENRFKYSTALSAGCPFLPCPSIIPSFPSIDPRLRPAMERNDRAMSIVNRIIRGSQSNKSQRVTKHSHPFLQDHLFSRHGDETLLVWKKARSGDYRLPWVLKQLPLELHKLVPALVAEEIRSRHQSGNLSRKQVQLSGENPGRKKGNRYNTTLLNVLHSLTLISRNRTFNQ